MKLQIIPLLLATSFCACINNAGNTEKQTYLDTATSLDTTTSLEINQNHQPQALDNWSYSNETDPMTNKIRYFATVESTNSIEFASPYDGGSKLQIIIRKMNGQNEVILQITKGQFMSVYNNKNVKIKFDDADVKDYGFNEPADASSTYIFMNSSAQLIQKFKKSKIVKIQPQFYQEGQSVFEFDVEGLKWDY